MRDQYAGDVSDLLKVVLLRTLAGDDKTVGVGWYYNPGHDGRVQDGRHREYCAESKWKELDLSVFNALRDLPERSVKALEELSIWPLRTRFHRAPLSLRGFRQSWTAEMQLALREADIIFLDPDNGVGNSSKHTTPAEVAAMRGRGRAVVVIKFPGRNGNHQSQIDSYHALLRVKTGAVSTVTVSTCVSVAVVDKNGILRSLPRIRWFTLIDADDALIERVKQFARRLCAIEKCKAYVV